MLTKKQADKARRRATDLLHQKVFAPTAYVPNGLASSQHGRYFQGGRPDGDLYRGNLSTQKLGLDQNKRLAVSMNRIPQGDILACTVAPRAVDRERQLAISQRHKDEGIRLLHNSDTPEPMINVLTRERLEVDPGMSEGLEFFSRGPLSRRTQERGEGIENRALLLGGTPMNAPLAWRRFGEPYVPVETYASAREKVMRAKQSSAKQPRTFRQWQAVRQRFAVQQQSLDKIQNQAFLWKHNGWFDAQMAEQSQQDEDRYNPQRGVGGPEGGSGEEPNAEEDKRKPDGGDVSDRDGDEQKGDSDRECLSREPCLSSFLPVVSVLCDTESDERVQWQVCRVASRVQKELRLRASRVPLRRFPRTSFLSLLLDERLDVPQDCHWELNSRGNACWLGKNYSKVTVPTVSSGWRVRFAKKMGLSQLALRTLHNLGSQKSCDLYPNRTDTDVQLRAFLAEQSEFVTTFVEDTLNSTPELSRLYVAMRLLEPDAVDPDGSKPFGSFLSRAGVFVQSLVAVAVHRQIALVLGELVDTAIENAWTKALLAVDGIVTALVVSSQQTTARLRQEHLHVVHHIDLLNLAAVVAPGHGCDMPLMDWCVHTCVGSISVGENAQRDWDRQLPDGYVKSYTKDLFKTTCTWLHAWLANPPREQANFSTLLPVPTADVNKRAHSKITQLLDGVRDELPPLPTSRSSRKKRAELSVQIQQKKEQLRLYRERRSIDLQKTKNKFRLSYQCQPQTSLTETEHIHALVQIEKEMADLDADVFSNSCVYAVTNLCVGSVLGSPNVCPASVSLVQLVEKAYGYLKTQNTRTRDLDVQARYGSSNRAPTMHFAV
jgi:hypothetical protein